MRVSQCSLMLDCICRCLSAECRLYSLHAPNTLCLSHIYLHWAAGEWNWLDYSCIPLSIYFSNPLQLVQNCSEPDGRGRKKQHMLQASNYPGRLGSSVWALWLQNWRRGRMQTCFKKMCIYIARSLVFTQYWLWGIIYCVLKSYLVASTPIRILHLRLRGASVSCEIASALVLVDTVECIRPFLKRLGADVVTSSYSVDLFSLELENSLTIFTQSFKISWFRCNKYTTELEAILYCSYPLISHGEGRSF